MSAQDFRNAIVTALARAALLAEGVELAYTENVLGHTGGASALATGAGTSASAAVSADAALIAAADAIVTACTARYAPKIS